MGEQNDENGWSEYRIYITKTLEDQSEMIKDIRDDIQEVKQGFSSLKTEVKIKLGVLAAVAGVGGGGVVQAIMNLF